MVKEVIKDIFRWLYFFPFRFIVGSIPFKWTYVLGKYAGIISYYVPSGKRRALEDELDKIFPDIGRGDRALEVKKSFINKMQTEFESLFYPDLNKGNIEGLVGCEGIPNLDKALKDGKGVMLLFAHFGANQMVMPAIGYRGYTMSQMSAPSTVWEEKMPNRKFSRIAKLGLEIRWKHEQSLPVKHINIFGSMKEAFLCLKRNEILGIAMDGGGGDKRVSVDFLGKRAFFATGAIGVAMRTNCAVLPTFMIRNSDGTNRMIIEPQMKMKSLDESPAAIEENTAAFVKRLEEYVRRYPCHYLNFLALRTYMEMQGDLPFMVNKNLENN